MLTTGLLTLSIHDTLTFDGIEIALHPDLFTEPAPRQSISVSRQLNHSGSSASLATAPSGTLGRNLHRRAPSLGDSFADPKTDNGAAYVADEGRAMPSSATSSVTSGKRPEVGDMIEIRVWDQIEGREQSSPRVFRRRPSPPNASIRSSAASSVVGDAHRKLATTPSLEAAISSLQRKSGTSSISMQYSADSGGEKDGGPPVDTVSGQGVEPAAPSDGDVPNINSESTKPPPVPRSRLNTADGTVSRNKPEAVSRSRTSATASQAADSPSSKAPFRGHHSRDISDMTVDTVFAGGNAGVETPFQASELGTFSMDSVDDPHAAEEHSTLSKMEKTHRLRLSFVMIVSDKTFTSLKGSARTQVSMLRQVADLYDLSSYDMVSVNKVEKADEASALEDVSADFITISFKEQFISRADMHYFQNSLIGRWVYEGERLVDLTKGITAHAREIRHKKNLARSGIVTSDTLITFRSRSARIVWLVQISSEMWDYASPYESGEHDQDARDKEAASELYFDKFVSFMYRLFEKWKALGVTHSLTVIFFSRTFVGSSAVSDAKASHVNVDVYGRRYEDHFKTVIGNATCSDWDSLVVQIKREFVKYPFEVGWNLARDGGRRPSTALQGNILEAINVTLNLMQFHYLDRDLHRTGNSIVVVSAGCGVFEVDRGLAGITYQRMMDHGIGSDMVSLGLPPLHTAPFFHYNNDVINVESDGVSESAYHEIPHWMHLSFVGYEDATPSAEPFSLAEPQKVTVPSQMIEIGPNGFLMPQHGIANGSQHPNEPQHPTSFSRLANVAASPKPSRSQTHQRRLISGRDFLDILEACRPRNTGYSLPTSLASLLLMRDNLRIGTSPRLSGDVPATHSDSRAMTKSPPMKEWGAVDNDEVKKRLISSKTRTVSGQSLVGVGLVESERSDSSGKSSPASSFTSQFSSMFGRSPAFASFVGLQLRPASVNAIRIHRSPSIKLDPLEQASEERSISGESLESAGNEPSIVEQSDAKEARDVDELRRRMLCYDKGFFTRAELKSAESAGLALAAGSMSPGSQSPIIGSTSPLDNVPPLVGGLGAALSQYQKRGSLGESMSSMERAHVKRVLSSGKIAAIAGHEMMGAFPKSTSLGPFLDQPLSVSPFLTNVGMAIDPEPPKQQGHRELAQHTSVESSSQRKLPDLGSSPLSSISKPMGIKPATIARSFNASKKGGSPTRARISGPVSSRSRKYSHHRNKRILNPFKQEDEEEVLAERSHNRRRWSHVFPLGEIEFKRNAGPNWKSLCQPAILPLTIDFLPKPQELGDMTFSHWNKLLVGMENSDYTSHSELLMEMVRQRLIQDYQLVPPAVVQESRSRGETDQARDKGNSTKSRVGHQKAALEAGENLESEQRGVIEHVLSMGYIVHVLKFDPTSESPNISVVQYNSRISQKELTAAFHYRYFSSSTSTQSFAKAVQTFNKYGNQYLWSRADALVCDGEYNLTSEYMRFRRIMFAIIPPRFEETAEEVEFVERFRRLEEYLSKLCETSHSEDSLRSIKILYEEEQHQSVSEELGFAKRRRMGTTDLMKRYTVRLRKGKRDPYEWLEMAVEPRFSTRRTFRIIFNWLVASSSKVDTQVQSLQRRCAQYGLPILVIPELSINSNLFLNPLSAPWIHCVRDKGKASNLDKGILERDFVDDGIYMTEPNFLECIVGGDEFTFPRNWRRDIAKIPARQFVHRSATLFIRLMVDEQGWAIVTAIEHKRLVHRDTTMRIKARKAFQDISAFIKSLDASLE